MTDKVTIYAPIFWEFCQKIQEAIQQGYVFSEDNDCFPTAFVGSYNATMVKPKVADEVPVEVITEKKGRKPTAK